MKKLAIVIAAVFMMVSLGYSRPVRIEKDSVSFGIVKKFETDGNQIQDAFFCTDISEVELLTSPSSMWELVDKGRLDEYIDEFQAVVVILLDKASNKEWALINMREGYTFLVCYTEL